MATKVDAYRSLPRKSLPRKAIDRRIHHGHSAQSVAVSWASRLIVKNAVRAWSMQPNLRWPFEYVDGLAGLLPRFRSRVQIEPIRLEDCTAEWIRVPGASLARAVLYLHGGAFLSCGLNTHRSLVTRLSKAADAGVLTVGYRKLPSHQIVDAINDGMSGLRWLQQRGYDDDQIVVAGDSAGGYLAFMTTLAAIRTHLAKPAGVATVSPFTDADPSRKLRHRNARRCAMFTRGALSMFARYLGEAQLSDATGTSGRIVSPVDADLSLLPPVTIHASSDELLLPDAELMAKRLNATGIRCDLHLWDGQIHDFPLAADILPEGRRAIRYIGDFVKEVTAGQDTREYGAAGGVQRTATAGRQ
ncbi:esterase [Mycobacterium haemophilum DSM 44634]|uniref:alpha/beta hydrolase n=1 Tax=Mycobacterium haemophilum TaxID=29311 RepID=UPI0006552178|nr:alpha/beta hydrolase [Mycobacterium haemophilum]AKN17146.1 esterase [Mycobacterium haemophilum DSM 44634]MCV7340601.1 alpha/beta hydrolase [Mycobacterium haemophilum DSM 44634]